MVRLSSTRQLCAQQSATELANATLYGGINYNTSPEEMEIASTHYAQRHLASTRAVVADTLTRAGVSYLPGTKREVEQIGKMLADNKVRVTLYTAEEANEESFKSLSGESPTVLHIATHGFYWTAQTAQQSSWLGERTEAVQDPLTRCGLLLSGANAALRGRGGELPEQVQDGILTAKEIALMDLTGVDLVVLSACETAKGDVESEGVYGLQRAFKQAGVGTIIMSLWTVDDQATQLLMTEFYKIWMLPGMSKRDAFLLAQDAVKKKYPEPKYWAAFVLLD